MRLNPDCIRDILLSIEDITDIQTIWKYQKGNCDFPLLAPYSHTEIVYHVFQCSSAGLITSLNHYDDCESLTVTDLSPAGHQFLANIRSNNVWNKTKHICTKVGSTSLSALMQISSGIILALIKSELGII